MPNISLRRNSEMKKFVLSLIVLSVVLLATIVYERYFVQSEFGPSTMLAVILLSGFVLALIITLVSFETRYHELVTRIWMITISTCITYIVVDLAAGWMLIKPLSPRAVPDKVRHHKLVPNTNSTFESPDFSYFQRVNNLGIRGEDRPLEKAANHYRVVTLGDSFTMGKGVEDNQTFSALLEESLNKQKACDSTVIEVLNGGVDSYSPILSYLQLKTDLAPLDPDFIIHLLDVSDLLQEAAYRKLAVYDDKGEILAVPGSERKSLMNRRLRFWIDQHLFFTRLILFYTNKLFAGKGLGDDEVVTRANDELVRYTLENDDVDRGEQWASIFDSISRIKKYADEKSIPYLLVIYPWGHQVNDKEWLPGRYFFMSKDAKASDKYHHQIYELTKKHSIELVNLFPTFRAYNGAEPLYFDYDLHWTVQGQKLVSKGLEQYLMDNHANRWCN